ERKAIAAGDAARGVDDDGLELRRGRPGTAHPQRAFLAHARAPGHPAARRDLERDAADRAVRRERLGGSRCRAPPTSPVIMVAEINTRKSPIHSDSHFTQIAMARLSTASSMVSRVQE